MTFLFQQLGAIMNRRYLLTPLLGILALLPLRAQDTCNVFTIPNPHGMAMTISRVFIADTVNFTVEPLRTVPFDIGATETWDARVCIKARDGQRHSTSIRYMTTHGQASFQLSMDAPGTAGIVAEWDAADAILAYPLPSTGTVTLQLAQPAAGTLRVRVIDAAGEAMTFDPLAQSGRELRLDLGGIAPGAYVAVVEADGRPIGRVSLLIAR